MPDRKAALARLPAAERARLERFLGRLDRMTVELMLTLVTTPADPAEHRAAVERAERYAHEAGRTDAIEALRADARDWVVALYNRSTVQPGWYEANWGRPGSASDRANLAAALGDALTALVIWDRLDERERDELAGPFGALTE